jgi:hypothetical protein
MTRNIRLAAAFALAALLASQAAAATTHRRHHPRHPATAAVAPNPAMAPARAGLVIAWDPESHTYTMPTPDRSLPLTAAERNAISRSFAGLVQVRHPDGSVSVDLLGRFQEFAVVRMGPDGKPLYRCLDDSGSVRRALCEPVPAPAAIEER